jgi:hypothetical protein
MKTKFPEKEQYRITKDGGIIPYNPKSIKMESGVTLYDNSIVVDGECLNHLDERSLDVGTALCDKCYRFLKLYLHIDEEKGLYKATKLCKTCLDLELRRK